MRIVLCGLMIVVVLAGTPAPGGLLCRASQGEEPTAALLLPFELTSDFERQTREGWESYPLAQDIGYDPTLQPEVRDGRRALVRRVQPTKEGELVLGFIRKVDLVLSSDSRLNFDYLTPTCSRVEGIEIGVFADKKRRARLEPASTGSWQRVEFPLNRLGLPPGTRLSAIYLAARLRDVEPEREERFYVDRISIAGQREPDFAFDEPEVIFDPHRRIALATKSYRVGDELRLRLRAPVLVENVQARLSAPDGRIVADVPSPALSLTLHRFASSDPPGIWHVEVHGSGVRTQLLLFFAPEPSHPRLLFDKSKREFNREVWQKLLARREELRRSVQVERAVAIEKLNVEELLPGLSAYFALLQPPAELALLEALGHYAFGEEDAARRARHLLIGMSELPQWVHPWFIAHGYRTYYPVGMVAAQLALAYDLIFETLSERERKTIERGLVQKVIKPAFEEYFLDNRIAFNTSNWISHAVGGSLLAALALDQEPVAAQILGLYLKFREHLDASYTDDGAYGEGFGYHKFDLETSAWVTAAARRLLGVDFLPKLERSYLYPLYASFGQGKILDFGDSSPEMGSLSSFTYLAAASRDPYLKQFYFFSGLPREGWQASSDPTLQRLYRNARGHTVSELIWDVPIPADKAEEFAPSRVFSEKGNVVLRSGWDARATVINMRAGAGFNHNHFDQGSVLIASGGEMLLGEAGPTHYYNDPFYRSYFIQAIGHNTILVDDDPESQAPPPTRELGEHPRITTVWLGSQIDYARAELESVYREKLHRYKRTLVYARGGPALLFDELASGEPHHYTAVFHPPSRESLRSLEERTFLISRGEARLLLRDFAPEGALVKVADGPLPLSAYERARSTDIESRARIEIRTPEASRSAFFLTLLQPADAAVEAEIKETLARAQLIKTATAAGIQIEGRAFLFARDENRPLRWQGYETDGEFLEVFGSRITTINASFLKSGNEVLVSSDAPLSFELTWEKDRVQISAQTRQPTLLRVGLAARPRRITIDGQPAPIVHIGGSLELRLEPGKHEVNVKR